MYLIVSIKPTRSLNVKVRQWLWLSGQRRLLSDNKGPRFESRQLQIFIYLCTVNRIEKTKIKEKWRRECPI